MSESAKVRLVRCPRCENLLPELTDYSVYQCGGCGTVLRAKNKNAEADSLTTLSADEQRVEEITEKFPEKIEKMCISEKRLTDLVNGLENDVESNKGSSTNGGEKGGDIAVVEVGDCAVENDVQVFDNMPESAHTKVTEDSRPSDMSTKATGPQRSGRTLDWRARESVLLENFRSIPRINGDFRSSTSKFCEESASSSYQVGSGYGFAGPMKSRNEPNGFNKVELLERDRAELLRKLDELKDQINRTCDVADKPKENSPLKRRAIDQDPYNVVGPPLVSKHYCDASYFMNGNESFYPSSHSANQVHGIRVPFRSQTLTQEPSHFQHQSHSHFPRRYMDNNIPNMDNFESYPNTTNFHHPSCTCFHCYHKHQVPQPVTTFPNNSMFYHHDRHNVFGSEDYSNPKPRFERPLPPLNPQHKRWVTDLNSEPSSGFARHRSQRVVLVPDGRKCHPIAGGAPFLTCFNCFELLQFPKKVNQKKIICGGCSTVVFFTVTNNKLIVSGHSETPTNVEDSSNVNGTNSYTHGHVNWASTDFSSDGYDFQSIDKHPLSSDPNKSTADMRSLRSTSSCTTEEENISSSGSLIDRRKQAKSAELPMQTNASSPPQGSPLQDHFDYSNNKYNLVGRLGKGNRSGRSERERDMVIPTRQNSIKDVALATEIDIPSNEYCNTGTSQESRGEEGQSKVNRGSESFLAGIIKKSFRSNQNNEQQSVNVMVNGHPIRDRLVKKAEKLAGPIKPGEYWYDFRAGFWGVMGGPCQGIIPPLIEEFNFPMPEKCAGGNTSVFVNGRELNKKDLDLLGNRGLPTERDRSYILEISGRVLDEDSGEELDCLGKLAPTVEKVKHGFGMKPPRIA